MADEELSPLEKTVQRAIQREMREKRRAWRYLALAFRTLMLWIAAVGAGLLVIADILGRLFAWSSNK